MEVTIYRSQLIAFTIIDLTDIRFVLSHGTRIVDAWDMRVYQSLLPVLSRLLQLVTTVLVRPTQCEESI